MKNDFATIPIIFPLVENFKDALELIPVRMRAIKNSFRPHGMYYFQIIISLLPSFTGYLLTTFLAYRLSAIFTNVAGPKKAPTFGGRAS